VIIPETVTFEEAIALTQSLLSQMEAGEINTQEFAEAIAQLVKTENGARGFFVTYLTSEGTIADNPSPELIEALQSSPDTVAELLVKNVAMSAAIAMTHRREGNEEIAQGSDQVRSRSTHLIEQAKLPQVGAFATQLHESAATGEGAYKAFLQKWDYDAQQRQEICDALEQIIPKEPLEQVEQVEQVTPESEVE
jgi:hypothetical protein